MSLTISSSTETIVLSDTDMPESIPLGQTVTATPQVLSDGSHILSITGETPNDITLSGTMRYADKDTGLSQVERIQRISNMKSRFEPVTISPYIGTVFITSVNYEIVRNGEVNYTITLFREFAGALSGEDVSSDTFSRLAGIKTGLDGLDATSQQSQEMIQKLSSDLSGIINSMGHNQ
jgi:hypothetical protein